MLPKLMNIFSVREPTTTYIKSLVHIKRLKTERAASILQSGHLMQRQSVLLETLTAGMMKLIKWFVLRIMVFMRHSLKVLMKANFINMLSILSRAQSFIRQILLLTSASFVREQLLLQQISVK